MVTLRDKLGVRENVLWLFYRFIKPSTWIVVTCAIRFWKFANYGTAMYPGMKASKMSIPEAFELFTRLSIKPLILWLLLFLLIEALVVTPIYEKYIVGNEG